MKTTKKILALVLLLVILCSCMGCSSCTDCFPDPPVDDVGEFAELTWGDLVEHYENETDPNYYSLSDLCSSLVIIVMLVIMLLPFGVNICLVMAIFRGVSNGGKCRETILSIFCLLWAVLLILLGLLFFICPLVSIKHYSIAIVVSNIVCLLVEGIEESNSSAKLGDSSTK